MEMFGHYRNQHEPVPLLWMPQWMKEGIALLSHCTNVESERKRVKDGIVR